MTTWRWGRKATFAAYSAMKTMTIAELIRVHRGSRFFMERTAVLMSDKPLRHRDEHTPALLQLLWDRYGVLPRDLIFVEVVHRKVPYIHENRYVVTAFDRGPGTGSIISVTLNFGFMEEPNVEAALEGMARHREIDRPWMVASGSCTCRTRICCRRTSWGRSDGFAFGSSCSCGWSRGPRTTLMGWATRCSSRRRFCRCDCSDDGYGRAPRASGHLGRQWTAMSDSTSLSSHR